MDRPARAVRGGLRCRRHPGLRVADRRIEASRRATPMTPTELGPTGIKRPTRTRFTRGAGRRRARRHRLAGSVRPGAVARRPGAARGGTHPLRPRPVGVAGLPGLRASPARQRGLPVSPRPAASPGTASPVPAPRSGCCSWRITLVTGSLWGHISWGTYWTWDSRLTTTAFLFVTYIGYLAVRGLGGSQQQRARAQRGGGPPGRARGAAGALQRQVVATAAPGPERRPQKNRRV